MKKLLSIFTILAALSTFAFAGNINTEIDLSYYGAGRTLSFAYEKGTLSENSPVGVDLNAVMYFVSLNQYVDIGLAGNIGIDTFGSFYTSFYTPVIGKDLSVGIAPAFRFNLGSFTSWYVAPGFTFDRMTADITSNSAQYFSSIVSFEVDAGYRGWFVTNPNYNLGVCAGLKLGVPFAGSFGDKENLIKIRGQFTKKFYLGLCMNFGTKSDAKRSTFKKIN